MDSTSRREIPSPIPRPRVRCHGEPSARTKGASRRRARECNTSSTISHFESDPARLVVPCSQFDEAAIGRPDGIVGHAQ